MWAKNKNTGFTIVELLIVIVVIGILAAISIVAYSGIQQRAKDAIRRHDLATIKTALLVYQAENGGVKSTFNYGGNGPGGWNISSSPSWLSFLSGYGKMPVDPVNTGITDPGTGLGLAYYYYCYNAGAGSMPATANVRIGFNSEDTSKNFGESFAVESCL